MEPFGVELLFKSIFSLQTWVILIIVAIFGMIGGLSHKLVSPPEDKTSLTGYIIVGMVASLAVLFVFTPSDAVRLIALSLAAGYGGKAILNALEARVKLAIAKVETAKVKEEGIEAVEAGKEAISRAQKLSQVKEEMEKALVKATKQSRKIILESSLKRSLSLDAYSLAAKSTDNLTDELKQLSNKLNYLEEYFKK